MAVDLEELVPSLRRMVSPPGTELLDGQTDGELVGYLSDAFWIAKLDGFFTNYTEDDGTVEPITGITDLPRDWQQFIVFYAGMQIVENQLRTTNTMFRSKAGPVEYEVQNSAQLLREHLKSLMDRRNYLLELLLNRYGVMPGYIDLVGARNNALIQGYVGFDGGTALPPGRTLRGEGDADW